MKYIEAMKMEGIDLEITCKKMKLNSLIKLANLISLEYKKNYIEYNRRYDLYVSKMSKKHANDFLYLWDIANKTDFILRANEDRYRIVVHEIAFRVVNDILCIGKYGHSNFYVNDFVYMVMAYGKFGELMKFPSDLETRLLRNKSIIKKDMMTRTPFSRTILESFKNDSIPANTYKKKSCAVIDYDLSEDYRF